MITKIFNNKIWKEKLKKSLFVILGFLIFFISSSIFFHTHSLEITNVDKCSLCYLIGIFQKNIVPICIILEIFLFFFFFVIVSKINLTNPLTSNSFIRAPPKINL